MMPGAHHASLSTSVPEYRWFSEAPANLRTRNQLAEQGLAPAGPVRARVVWRRGQRSADLFALEEARAKKVPTAAQRAALQKAQEAQEARRRTCGHCGRVRPFRVGEEPCDLCLDDEERGAREHACTQAARLLGLGERAVILDVETADLYGAVVEIAILSLAGDVLLHERVHPQGPIAPGAEAVHGITLADLAAAPPFGALLARVQPLLEGRRVIAYNAEHERAVLTFELGRSAPGAAWFETIRWRCAMRLYAEFVGDWSDYHEWWRYQPLPGGDHTALGDCRATLLVLQKMAGAQAAAVPSEEPPHPAPQGAASLEESRHG